MQPAKMLTQQFSRVRPLESMVTIEIGLQNKLYTAVGHYVPLSTKLLLPQA